MLIYGNVPRDLPGSYRYGNSAAIDETLATGETSSPSYFDVARRMEDTNHISVAITPASPGDAFEVDIEISTNDGDDWMLLRKVTEENPHAFRISYEHGSHKLRFSVVAAVGDIRCEMRQ